MADAAPPARRRAAGVRGAGVRGRRARVARRPPGRHQRHRQVRGPTATLTAADPALEARMLAITGELRCLVCQNQTIADSHADLAVDLRQQVREMLQARPDDRPGPPLHDRPLRRLHPLPPAAQGDARPCCGWARRLLLAVALVALAVVIRRRARLADDQFEPEPRARGRRARPASARPGTLRMTLFVILSLAAGRGHAGDPRLARAGRRPRHRRGHRGRGRHAAHARAGHRAGAAGRSRWPAAATPGSARRACCR